MTTVVGAAVSILCPFALPRRPFLRDIFVYIGGTIWILVILIRGRIYFAESVGFLVMYAVYVLIAVVGRVVRKSCLRELLLLLPLPVKLRIQLAIRAACLACS